MTPPRVDAAPNCRGVTAPRNEKPPEGLVKGARVGLGSLEESHPTSKLKGGMSMARYSGTSNNKDFNKALALGSMRPRKNWVRPRRLDPARHFRGEWQVVGQTDLTVEIEASIP